MNQSDNEPTDGKMSINSHLLTLKGRLSMYTVVKSALPGFSKTGTSWKLTCPKLVDHILVCFSVNTRTEQNRTEH